MEILGKIKKGIFCKIVGFVENVPLKIKRRLLELGLTSGQKVRIVRKSILGKACLIEVRGYLLSLRTSLLSYLIVEEGKCLG